MNASLWVWQQPEWPDFQWCPERLRMLLGACAQAQERLCQRLADVDETTAVSASLDALLQNTIMSSAIEGERLNADAVRASLARRLGLNETGRTTPRSEGLAELLVDATRECQSPLDMQRLLDWHRWLFPTEDSLSTRPLRVGTLRGEEPMQVVSGRLDRPTVHFEAPPREGLEHQLDEFLTWFERSRGDAHLDPALRAGIAHFWFVTVHPFDDGNGRLTRAITDRALAQGEGRTIRFYAMSASILEDRAGYYRVLEASQKGGLDITAWLQWFLSTLLNSLEQALSRIDRVLAKARFWHAHRGQVLSAEQIKVLNRLLDGGERGFEEGLNAAQYQAVAKVSKATATRHLGDLVQKGCLVKLPGGGRSTRYRVAQV